MATRNSVASAINSLANDGIVRVTRQEHEQFEALLEDYFDASDVSDDEVGSDDEMECGKITMFIQGISVNYTNHTASNEYHMTMDDYNIQDDSNNNINDSEEQGFSEGTQIHNYRELVMMHGHRFIRS